MGDHDCDGYNCCPLAPRIAELESRLQDAYDELERCAASFRHLSNGDKRMLLSAESVEMTLRELRLDESLREGGWVMSALKPCPFCGAVPSIPYGFGTQYEIECKECGMACSSVQICDLMTYEERQSADAWDTLALRYADRYVDRARQEAIKRWNTRHDALLNGEGE